MTTNTVDANDELFSGYLNACSKINDLDQFKEYSDALLNRERAWFEEEAHVDLEQEFLPLFAETFPPILHTSIVISSVILLENEIKIFSGLLDKHQSNKLSINDMSGSLLEKFKKYVGGLAGLDFDFAGSNWRDIKGLYEIRNCLVHNGGSIDKFSNFKTIQDFSARHNTPLQENDVLVLDAESSNVAVSLISNFIDGIYASALRLFPGKHNIP